MMKKIVYLLFVMFALSSCSNDGRMFKKFLSRLNAKEINASSLYIYPGDYAKLRLFAEVLEKNPNTFFKLCDKRNIEHNGLEGIIVELECVNPSPYFRNYMERLNLLQPSGMIIDTLYIRETNDGEYLSFNWADIEGENLKIATIADTTKVQSMNIRAGMGTDYKIVGELKPEQHIIIDDYSENPDWARCFTIDEQCNTVQGYIYRPSLSSTDTTFFPLGIFDSMGLLIAVIVIVVIGALVWALNAIVSVLLGAGPVGWVLVVALILGLLYTIYQCLEKILFELFIINLPY